jgi:hypothetical protein
MSLHCFYIPARHPEPAQSELNAFLSSHRVLAVPSTSIPATQDTVPLARTWFPRRTTWFPRH